MRNEKYVKALTALTFIDPVLNMCAQNIAAANSFIVNGVQKIYCVGVLTIVLL